MLFLLFGHLAFIYHEKTNAVLLWLTMPEQSSLPIEMAPPLRNSCMQIFSYF